MYASIHKSVVLVVITLFLMIASYDYIACVIAALLWLLTTSSRRKVCRSLFLSEV